MKKPNSDYQPPNPLSIDTTCTLKLGTGARSPDGMCQMQPPIYPLGQDHHGFCDSFSKESCPRYVLHQMMRDAQKRRELSKAAHQPE